MSSILPPNLELENYLYISLILTSIACGLYIGLLFTIVCMLMKNRKKLPPTTRNLYLIFEGLVFLLSIPALACMIMMGLEAWIIHREDPGTLDGPLAYFYSLNFTFEVYPGTTLWYPALNNLTMKIAMFLGDALLVYRCYRVFGSHPFIVASLGLCLISYLGLAIFESIAFGIAPVTMAIMVMVNIMVTAMISINIIAMAKRIRGSPQANKSYTGISVILVESAAPWAIMGILLLAGFIFFNWWPSAYILWMVIGLLSPQIIILRAAMCIAWDENTSHELSQLGSMTFASVPSAINLDTQGSGRSDEQKSSTVEDMHISDTEANRRSALNSVQNV